VAKEAYAALIDLGSRREIVERNANVMENLSQQGLSAHKTACKLIVFCLPRDFAPVSVFKRDGVWRNHDVAAFGKLSTICLIWITRETNYLALSRIKMPSMLMMSKDSTRWFDRVFWKKDERLYTLVLFDSIFNGLADIGAAIHVIQYY
jgi:hypothetical protein